MSNPKHSALSYLNHDTPISAAWDNVGQSRLIPPKWVIQNVIPTGLTIHIAQPKSFKSTVDLHWMLRLVGKQPTLLPEHVSKPVRLGTVLMIATETKPGKIKFDAMFGLSVSLSESDPLHVQCNPFAFRLDNPDNIKELIYWLRRIQPLALVIDPLANSHGVDENDAGDMIAMVQPLQQYAIDNDMAVILVHHTRKPGEKAKVDEILDPNMGRGTGALVGLADGIITQAIVSGPTEESPDDPFILRMAGKYKSGNAFREDLELNLDWARMNLDATIAANVFNAIMDGPIAAEDCARTLGLREQDVLKYFLYMNKQKMIVRIGQKWEVVT